MDNDNMKNVKKLTMIKWTFEIVLIIALSFMYYLNLPITTSKVQYIPSGSVTKIITYLGKNGIEVSSIDSYIIRFIGMPQQGWINIATQRLTRADYLYKLTTAKAAMQDITLIPGETTIVFMQQVAQQMHLDFSKLMEYYNRYSPLKEGALVPDTYKLPIGIDEAMLVKLLLQKSQATMEAYSQKIFGTYNAKKWYYYIRMASVIQKEAASIEDMPYISSVIHNRLKKGMALQMDGSLNYGKYSHVKITAKRIRSDTSRYNTYKYKGIPKDAVCNVSLDAIRAAIKPANTDYLYFVKTAKGKHSYSRYYSTHLRNIRGATK